MYYVVRSMLLIAVALMLTPGDANAQRVRLEARLTGPTLASGQAKFEQRGARRKYNVELEDAARNTLYKVTIRRGTRTINGGSFRTNRFGRGGIDLDTAEGDAVNLVLRVGDRVEIRRGSRVIVSGAMRSR